MWFQSPVGSVKFHGSSNWLTEAHECDWAQVVCIDIHGGKKPKRYVVEIQLEVDNMYGRIPDNVALLTTLSRYYVEYNHLGSTIPTTIGKLTSLVAFNAAHNKIHGTLPEEIGQLQRMQWFDVGPNLLTGTVPSSIGSFTNIWVFDVSRNVGLTGTIPSTIRNWEVLKYGYFHNTSLSGTMPLCTNWKTWIHLVADCDRVYCPCCTHCCPQSTHGKPEFQCEST